MRVGPQTGQRIDKELSVTLLGLKERMNELHSLY